MNIGILDPGLREVTGHHFDFVRKIHKYLINQGHQVHIYSHIDAVSDVLVQFNDITPIFRSFPYPQFHGEILDYHHHSKLVKEDLQKIPDADIWIWPSTFSFHVNGYRLSDSKTKSVGCIHVEYDFHHTVYGKEQWTHGFTERFKLFAMEHKLVSDYISIGINCNLVPNPVENTPILSQKEQLKTIGFFGHQRLDKGSATLLSIVDSLKDNYSIILHDSAGQVKYSHPNVKCIASVPEISEIIKLCDLVILPYDRKKYEKMSSAILYEALSIGIPCVVPSGTTLSDWIERTESGVVFYENDIFDAISRADSRYNVISSNSLTTARAWPLQYGTEKFINILTEESYLA